MLRVRYLIGLFLIASLLPLTACDSGGNDPEDLDRNTMEARVDGDRWDGVGVAAGSFGTSVDNVVVISGVKPSDGTAIVLWVFGVDGTGRYSLRNFNDLSAISDENLPLVVAVFGETLDTNIDNVDEEAGFFSIGGELNITQVTETHIQGTFSFDAMHMNNNTRLSIRDGRFNIDMNRF